MWLSYTYLFVRMRINPHVYGISLEEVEVNKHLNCTVLFISNFYLTFLLLFLTVRSNVGQQKKRVYY